MSFILLYCVFSTPNVMRGELNFKKKRKRHCFKEKGRMGEGGEGGEFHRIARKSFRGRTLLRPFDSPQGLELPEKSGEDPRVRVTTSRRFQWEILYRNRQSWDVRGITFDCSPKGGSIVDPVANM